MEPPPYKGDHIANSRARFLSRLNAPPYTDGQTSFFRVQYLETRHMSDGSLWDQFNVLRAASSKLSSAWSAYPQHTDHCTEPVSFYVLVPQQRYLDDVWLPMSKDTRCVCESLGLGIAGCFLSAWGVWGLWSQ